MFSFLASIFSVFALTSTLACPVKAPDSEPVSASYYNHRVVALQPTLTYERIALGGLYVGFDSFVTGAFRGQNDLTSVFMTGLRVGRSFEITTKSKVTPVVGATLFRDLDEVKFIQQGKDGASSREWIAKHPFLMHGVVGFMGEYEFTRAFGVGLNAEAMIGKVWGAPYDGIKELSYGFNGSLPMTFKFGCSLHWDFRLEPFYTVFKDYNHYVGLRSGVGYRF